MLSGSLSPSLKILHFSFSNLINNNITASGSEIGGVHLKQKKS